MGHTTLSLAVARTAEHRVVLSPVLAAPAAAHTTARNIPVNIANQELTLASHAILIWLMIHGDHKADTKVPAVATHLDTQMAVQPTKRSMLPNPLTSNLLAATLVYQTQRTPTFQHLSRQVRLLASHSWPHCK